MPKSSSVVGLSTSAVSSPKGFVQLFFQGVGYPPNASCSYYQPIPNYWFTGIMLEGGGKAGIAVAGFVLTSAALFALYLIHQSNKSAGAATRTTTIGGGSSSRASRSLPPATKTKDTVSIPTGAPATDSQTKEAEKKPEEAATETAAMEKAEKSEEGKSSGPEADKAAGATGGVAADDDKPAETDDAAGAAEKDAEVDELEAKLTEIPVPKDEDIQAIFDDVDKNKDGKLTMPEVEKAIIQRKSQFDLKPTIVMRAFQKADSDNDGVINREEFFSFVRFITYYKNLYSVFDSMDTDKDRRLTKDEFLKTASILKVDDPEAVFKEMDENKGGYIVFDEFCIWMAEKRAAENAF